MVIYYFIHAPLLLTENINKSTMESLWKKETTENHIRYIDLFATLQEENELTDEVIHRLEAMKFQKDNNKSTESRKRGNDAFKAGNWEQAMEWYNKSLCLAEVGSENIALAYSNRSACFLHLDMLDEALAGIELAKKAKLPDHLLPKLEDRRKKCLKLANMVPREPDFVPKLDYEANKHFPCLANVVDIEYNQEYGRHLVANSDIPSDKTILLEENFAVSHVEDNSMCYTCYRAIFSNFIACEQCTNVMFCSIECKNRNKTHDLECGTLFAFRDYNDVETQLRITRSKLIIQTILTAISTFSNVEHLMQFIENILQEDSNLLPTSTHDQVSKYQFFFKLKKRMVANLADVKRLYKFIMCLPKVRAMFDSVDKQRFLMHMIAHHSFVVDTNSIGSNTVSNVNNVFSLFNHSCAPNIIHKSSGKLSFCKTSRRVKKGEQLFISYLSPYEMELLKEHRQEKLRSGWGFDCLCKKCV